MVGRTEPPSGPVLFDTSVLKQMYKETVKVVIISRLGNKDLSTNLF